MREIKFRCYNKKTQKMWDADSLRNMGGFALQSGHSSNDFLVLPYPSDDYVLMQYTGLKDKNGVEIYDGDILKCFGDIAKVVWDSNDALYRYVYNSGGERYMEILGTHSYEHFEVIGNIYENPELLETT